MHAGFASYMTIDPAPVVGHHQASVPLYLMFALDSDLSPSGKSEGERLSELFDPDDMMLRGVCVMERGYWAPNRRLLWDPDRGSLIVDPDHVTRPPWIEVRADGAYSEVLRPLSLMFDLIAKLSISRGVPLLSAYLSGG